MRINKKKIAKLTSGIDIYTYGKIDSTNTQARRLILSNPTSPALIIAKKQTAGRGRMGRSFYSSGNGIYMSFVFPVSESEHAVSVTTAAASATVHALLCNCEGDFLIKWVNDIYNYQKKVCGILAECASSLENNKYMIVGIGINVGKNKFPPEIQDIAGSVDVITSAEQLIASIVNDLKKFALHPLDRSYMSLYREHFMLGGASVSATHNGHEVIGEVIGVDDDGGLLLSVDGEKVRIFSGEVTVRRIND
ncbi:MAG: biotin--[acetyl-CoA-carboxylase] ligase [Ruminococcaceae bacterium]|nr:biotin--[acetyl-CoA-carboxylase] ligase [Oscillospiraceae bacterium]